MTTTSMATGSDPVMQKARRLGQAITGRDPNAASMESSTRSSASLPARPDSSAPAMQRGALPRPPAGVQCLRLEDMETRTAPDGSVRAMALLEEFPALFSEILYGLPVGQLRSALWLQGHRLPARLCNLGNTCFMNAVVQVLSRVEAFVLLLQAHRDACSLSATGHQCSMCTLAWLCHDIHNLDIAEPVGFASLVRAGEFGDDFRGHQGGSGRQCDAFEFMCNVLGKFAARERQDLQRLGAPQLESAVDSSRSSLSEYVCGLVTRRRLCCVEHPAHVSDSLHWDLIAQLDVRSAQGATLHLEDLWKSWVNCVEHDEYTKCPFHESDGCTARSARVLFLEREPPVLFLCLSRDIRHADGRQSKDTRPVVFPEKLEWLRSGQYRFAALIRHSGAGLGSGHYTSHVLLGESSAGASVYAYCNDDATVLTHSWPQLAVRQVQQEAYILVYHRAQAYQHAHDDGTRSTPYRRERQSEVVCSQGVPAQPGTAVASSSRQSQPGPSASSSSSSRAFEPVQVSVTPPMSSAGTAGASGSSARARAPHPRRTLRRSYTMYPADGSAGDLPAPRMSPALPPWVSSLAPEHMLPHSTAAVSSTEGPERPDVDLVVPMVVAQSDGDITQQLANMHLEPQSVDAALPQHRPQSSPPAGRPKAVPRATRLPGFSRPRTRASLGKGNTQSGAPP